MQDTPSLVNLLSVLVEIFGPIPLFLKNYQNYHGKSDVKSYLELFNSELLPWCFNGKYNTCNSKIDLLLSLFQNECFFDQWCSIIKYTRTEQKHSIDDKTSKMKSRLELLTLLLQKVRERIAGGKLRNLQKNGYLPEHWRHDLLDSTATSVLCDLTAADRHVSFLWYVLQSLSICSFVNVFISRCQHTGLICPFMCKISVLHLVARIRRIRFVFFLLRLFIKF